MQLVKVTKTLLYSVLITIGVLCVGAALSVLLPHKAEAQHTMVDPVLRALEVAKFDGSGAVKVNISASTKPFVLPAYLLGATTPLDISGGATVRAGPLTVGSTYKATCNTSTYQDQGDVTVVSTTDDDFMGADDPTFYTITAGNDYVSVITELGAIIGARCSFSAVTIP